MQARLIGSLTNPAIYGTPVDHVEVLETHISYVLLTGPYAYKIKKAVNLEFLNFTTLGARHFDCREELRLNRPLAPSLYLDVVAITGTVETPAINGDGPILEYAVKMRQFPQEALVSRLLQEGRLSAGDVDALAATVASFHRRTAVARPDSAFGRPAKVLEEAQQNFSQIRPRLDAADDQTELDAIAAETAREHARRAADFEKRRCHRFVRECHGDLHLGNIARVDGQITLFDRITFNPLLRWIDVMSDVAFLVMDLQHRGRADLAFRVLNAYLEKTGDYCGLTVLGFYLAYRAMVRAKIACFQADQAEYREYARLARSYFCNPRPALVVMHGLSGSGKSTVSQALAESVGAIRIRTDVERKRLHGLAPEEDSQSAIDAGLYAPHRTQETYHRVRELAHRVLTAGYIAVLDGAFLKRSQRDLAHTLADDLGVPFLIIDLPADIATLRGRLTTRIEGGRDVSEADLKVLDRQMATAESIASDERPFTIDCDTENAAPLPEILRQRPDLVLPSPGGWTRDSMS